MKNILLPGLSCLGILMQSCCAPNACRYAKSGSAALAKTLAQIEDYKGRNGNYPVTLDNIRPGLLAQAERELHAACPECGELGYRTDSFGFELQYRYSHVGPNWCAYTADAGKWDCHGNY